MGLRKYNWSKGIPNIIWVNNSSVEPGGGSSIYAKPPVSTRCRPERSEVATIAFES